jgi:hypothetical protein
VFRVSILEPNLMKSLMQKLYGMVKHNSALRSVDLHEYPIKDHAAVGATALANGIDYVMHWFDCKYC